MGFITKPTIHDESDTRSPANLTYSEIYVGERLGTVTPIRQELIANISPKLLFGLMVATLTGFLSGCRVSTPLATLPPGFYWITSKSDSKLARQKGYVIDSGDSIRVINPANDQRYILPTNPNQRWSFRHTKLDVVAFTIPFKVRRRENGIPPQYDTDFNTAFYVGRRINNYTYQQKSISPTYTVRQLRSHGLGYGLFFGVGSTNVSNDVMRSPINISYQGVVLHAGVATIYDAGPFNFGLAVGMDHLIDPNRRYWIYQYKPWFGVLFGLNLN